MTELVMAETPQQAQPKPLQLIKNGLIAMGDQLTSVLPAHVTRERFVQVVCTAVAHSPDLSEVAMTAGGRQSIFISCIQCASDGLIPDNREAALVAFNKRVKTRGEADRWEKHAQYMPMVRGIVNRIQQSGDAREVGVELVYKTEVDDGRFRYRRTHHGVEFLHDPDTFNPNKGEAVGVYANMVTRDGGFYVAVLSAADIASIKASSKGSNTPWHGPFETEMWKKSAIKRLAKIAPVSAEVRRMLDQDSEKFHTFDAPESPKLIDRLQAKSLAAPSSRKDVDPEPEPDPPAGAAALPADEPEEDEPEQAAAEIAPEADEAEQEEAAAGDALPPPPGELHRTKKGALEYAQRWAAYWKAIPKDAEDAFLAETEAVTVLAKNLNPATVDVIDDAFNAPKMLV